MKILTLPIDRFVSLNKLPEVTSSIFLEKDRAVEDGLFSVELFGSPGSKKRQQQYGYIDLGTMILHPFLYRQFTLMDANIGKIISGKITARLGNQNELITGDGGETGIDFLVKNLKNINFKKTESLARENKLEIIKKLPHEHIFASKWIVRPAWYRDIDFSAERIINTVEINEVYQRIISISRMIKASTKGSEVYHNAVYRQHEAVYEAHKMLYEDQIPKKKGKMKQTIIGKVPDYRSLTVIAIPKISEAETPEDIEVGFSEIGFPVHVACSMFWPFTIKAVNSILGDRLIGYKRINVGGTKVNAEIISDQLTEKAIAKMFRLFKVSIESRFQPIMVDGENGEKIKLALFPKALKRDFTLADLFFIAASRAVEGKMVTEVRYPITSHQSIQYLTPKIISTEQTVNMDLGLMGKFKNYPDINCEFWREASAMDISCFKVMDADSDGDQVGGYAPFTIEAIAEAKKIKESKALMLKANGSPARSFGNESILTAYSMTY